MYEELDELFKSSGGLRREDFEILFDRAIDSDSSGGGDSEPSRKRSAAAIQTPALPSQKRLAAAIRIPEKRAGWTVEQMRSYIDPKSW